MLYQEATGHSPQRVTAWPTYAFLIKQEKECVPEVIED